MNNVTIFTDGACRGNPGPGGWGAILTWNGEEKTLSGAEPETTNNRMELMAAIIALESLNRDCKVVLYTDSEYLRRGITEWLLQWKSRSWKTASRKPVKNVDLWKRLDKAASTHTIDWHWVKGHSGDKGNERADQLANGAVDKLIED